MDVVTDLTTQTVTYITLIQDVYRWNQKLGISGLEIWEPDLSNDLELECNPDHKDRLKEIIFFSKHQSAEVGDELVIKHFLTLTSQLLLWLKFNQIGHEFEGQGDQKLANLTESPAYWRQKIRQLLYRNSKARVELVEIIHYLPVLVLYAINDHKPPGVYRQRLYQVYSSGSGSFFSFSQKDAKVWSKWWEGKQPQALQLLQDDAALLKVLKEKDIALPFEAFFPEELGEIRASRKERIPNYADTFVNAKEDPFVIGTSMKLHGLAFSGGGIRSATFNLGILQKLAELNVLSKFDYLSTVSGGGYIGGWLSSWILRAGSLHKVVQRLNPTNSIDPLADEVRPIRWLRMYSNYLTPNASIMSTDSWTAGITWLRNCIINQIILLLFFITTLSLIQWAHIGWEYMRDRPAEDFPNHDLWFVSCLFVFGAAILVGLGMRMFDRVKSTKWNLGTSSYLPHMLIGLAVSVAFFVSAWFGGYPGNPLDLSAKFEVLIYPVGITSCLGMLFIAFVGNYHHYKTLEKEIDTKAIFQDLLSRVGAQAKNNNELSYFWLQVLPIIILSSVVASIAGTFLLAAVWEMLKSLRDWQFLDNPIFFVDSHAFYTQYSIQHYVSWITAHENVISKATIILGVPMILEAMSLTVVIRMTIMGRIFPDARREWWGRMGALMHRFMLIWVVATLGALIIPTIFKSSPFRHLLSLPFIAGGWSAVILYAVRLAFTSTDSDQDKNKSEWKITDIFVRVAPYLFMLGFLLIAAYTLDFIDSSLPDDYLNQFFPKDRQHLKYPWLHCTAKIIALAAVTYLLSWRAGVNEFSLHHFYRNRIVRAYLGATRRRIDRDKTSNSFTGFDSKDDLKLADFITSKKYTGPYPIINTALNATAVSVLDRQDRKAESFIFSPLYCGYDFSPTRSAAYTKHMAYEYGNRETHKYSTPGGPSLGTAIATSGAAVNPSMGYHSSPATAFLLTMFNVRLGWWIGNPRSSAWKHSEPTTGLAYLIKDLIGKSDIKTDYVCLSDGGHFDNMGIYELVRRKCSYILLCDAEQDELSTCEGLANAIRRCRIDFGVEIELNLSAILDRDPTTDFVSAHLQTGTIHYPGDTENGTIVYVKTSLKTPETVDIREYAKSNKKFPQESTGDQFFNEAQFESYRKLGYESIQTATEIGL